MGHATKNLFAVSGVEEIRLGRVVHRTVLEGVPVTSITPGAYVKADANDVPRWVVDDHLPDIISHRCTYCQEQVTPGEHDCPKAPLARRLLNKVRSFVKGQVP